MTVDGPPLIDANVLVRHVAGDHPDHSPAARRLVAQLEAGETSVELTHVVIAEVTHVLGSPRLFAVPRVDIRNALLPIIRLEAVRSDSKGTLARALGIFADSRLDFVDAYLAAVAEDRNVPVISFDRDFDSLAGVRRVEPA